VSSLQKEPAFDITPGNTWSHR